RLSTRSKIEVPIIIERAKEDGPVLLLMAGIHGDEVNGVEIVRQIVANKYNKPEKGVVICVPVVNVFGFINETRPFPDGRDLNRMFPGSAKGSLASRFAFHFLNEVATHVDYCIDYHTGGAQRFNHSQIRIVGNKQNHMDLAHVFSTKFIMIAKQREHSFRDVMSRREKTVLLFEGGKSMHLDRTVTREGIQGALRVMQHLGMRDFSKVIIPGSEKPIVIRKTSWVRAKYSGMFRSSVKLGQSIKRHDVLGSVSDPFGLFERKITSRHDGHIINVNHAPVVLQGDALINIGLEN
ncbi:MAG: succinylglutamate desuccinylase, partial [Flavobacteriales bacterium]|nr:succinylglutamate desuccinylase [Flavobacteriales bacterium]